MPAKKSASAKSSASKALVWGRKEVGAVMRIMDDINTREALAAPLDSCRAALASKQMREKLAASDFAAFKAFITDMSGFVPSDDDVETRQAMSEAASERLTGQLVWLDSVCSSGELENAAPELAKPASQLLRVLGWGASGRSTQGKYKDRVRAGKKGMLIYLEADIVEAFSEIASLMSISASELLRRVVRQTVESYTDPAKQEELVRAQVERVREGLARRGLTKK